MSNHNPLKIPRSILTSNAFLSLDYASQVLLFCLYLNADRVGLVDTTAALKLYDMQERSLTDLIRAGFVIPTENNNPVVAIKHWFKAYPEYNNGNTRSDYPELQRLLLVENGIYKKKE